ncbi:MAG: FAD-binding protein [Bacteroidetes bacterium]|nr:FAD-binding protein [Bacteroidota bacterium]
MTTDQIQKLNNSIDDILILTDEENRKGYGHDYTEDFVFMPDAVVIPENVEQVSKVLRWCNENKIPLTVRGAGTGLSGGCLPIKGGITLSMEKFNKVLEIDEENLQATVEPGVINQNFRDQVELKGLFYPPDPASRGSCFLGGNIAHCSGGPKAVKYGVTRDYILNLEVVLANGEVIWTGANTLKYSTGYNLTQLMIGSEGTLAVVTKIVVKLIARPKHDVLMWCSFKNAVPACASVSEIMRSGVTPSALELMERSGIRITCKYNELHDPTNADDDAVLLIELDGDQLDLLFEQAELINGILEKYGVSEVLFADSNDQKEKWWKIRKSIGEVVKLYSTYKEEDTVVMRAGLPELMSGVKEIGNRYGFSSVCYGHAGDGNLHVNILKENMSEEDWSGPHLEEGIREIFRLCKKLGGTISGEHGVGLVQQKYLNEVMAETHINLMKGIKKVFDPNGILNPGKMGL